MRKKKKGKCYLEGKIKLGGRMEGSCSKGGSSDFAKKKRAPWGAEIPKGEEKGH